MPSSNVLEFSNSKSFKLEDLFGGVSQAYLIGVSAYQNDIPPLSGPSKDITLLAETFKSQGFETTTILNEEASFDGIQALFETGPISKLTEEDRLVIYFAGHGIAKNSDTVPKGYLLPWDANLEGDKLIAMDWLDDQLAKLECRHILLVLDCCYAGAFQWSTGKRDVFQMVENVYVESLMRFTESPARQVITSAAYDQVAQDTAKTSNLSIEGEEITLTSREFKGDNSPFALALHEGLSEGKADTSGKGEAVAGSGKQDSIITATELYTYVRDRVHFLTYGTTSSPDQKRQSPAFFPLSKHDSKGEFIFFNQENIELQFAPDVNPYKVTEAYGEADAKLFYGWSLLELQSLVTEIQQNKGNIILLLGDAKSGKTSLLQAGLMAYLKRQKISHQSIDLGNNSHELDAVQKDADLLLLDHLDQAMFDQSEQGQRALIAQIENLRNEKLVITLRPENYNSFYSLIAESRKPFVSKILLKRIRLWNHEGEVLNLQTSSKDTESVLEDDKSVIRKKLRDIALYSGRKSAVFLESEDLVGELVGELNQKQIRQKLPLLSRVLSSMYDNYSKDFNRSDRVLRFQDFHQVGGIIGSLIKIAEEFYRDLISEEPEKVNALKKLLLRMVKFEEDNSSQTENTVMSHDKLSARVITQKDIIFSKEEDNEYILELLTRLEHKGIVCRFLLDSDGQNEGEEIIGYQLVHPGLISQWRALRVWARREAFYLESIHDVEKPSTDFQKKLSEPQNQRYKSQTEKFAQANSVAAQFFQWLKLKKRNSFEGIWHDKVDIDSLYSMTELSKKDIDTQNLQNRTNLFNKKEDDFIRFSYALRERKKKNIRFWRYTLLGVLGVVIIVIGLFWRQAVLNKDLAVENEKIAVAAQQKAENRLQKIFYQDHLQIKNRADNYKSLRQFHYAYNEYMKAKNLLLDIEKEYHFDVLLDKKGNEHYLATLMENMIDAAELSKRNIP